MVSEIRRKGMPRHRGWENQRQSNLSLLWLAMWWSRLGQSKNYRCTDRAKHGVRCVQSVASYNSLLTLETHSNALQWGPLEKKTHFHDFSSYSSRTLQLELLLNFIAPNRVTHNIQLRTLSNSNAKSQGRPSSPPAMRTLTIVAV